MNLATVEIKAFVPARDFEVSKRFYQAIGFSMPWSDDDLACLSAGECSFLLQRFFVEEHARNVQMHLLVGNVDDWYAHVVAQDVVTRFGVRLGELEERPWGMRDFTLTDPAGVLWRIAQNIPEATR